MNNLSRLQHEFQARVLTPDAADAPAWVSAGGRAAPATQLGVYCHAYRARLQEVLAKDFPAINLAMGDDDFYDLVDKYIQVHPSSFFSLRDFGEQFAGYIAQQSIHHEQSWLAELAEFEWTLCDAFDAADAPLVTEQEIAGIAPERWPQLRFAVHPSLRCLKVNWNIPEIWKVLKSDNPHEVKLIPVAATGWLIWRNDLITRFRSLAEDEQAALACLCREGSFDDICQVLADFHAIEHVPLHAATYLKTWLHQGLLTRILA